METFVGSASATYFYMSDVHAAVDTTRPIRTGSPLPKNVSASAEGIRFKYRSAKTKK